MKTTFFPKDLAYRFSTLLVVAGCYLFMRFVITDANIKAFLLNYHIKRFFIKNEPCKDNYSTFDSTLILFIPVLHYYCFFSASIDSEQKPKYWQICSAIFGTVSCSRVSFIIFRSFSISVRVPPKKSSIPLINSEAKIKADRA